jgi:protease-4
MPPGLKIASLCLLLTGCMPEGLLVTPVTTRRSLVEQTLLRDPGLVFTKIALIDVDGILLNMPEPQFFGEGEHPVSLLLEQLDKARRDRDVKAAVLRINSPGGAVTAAELMHHEVRRFRASGKPIVAVMMDVAASGGYYIACACDEIWAHRSSVTGSIGVVSQFFDLTGTMKKIGVAAPAITSGPNKTAGSPLETMSPEQREIFQAIVDDLYQSFLAVVQQGRPNLSEERIRELADGRVFSAAQALEVGLIDRIGTLHEALVSVKEAIGAKSARVVAYRRPLGYKPNYYAGAYPHVPDGGQVNLIHVDLPTLLRTTTPQFLYLWAPGL